MKKVLVVDDEEGFTRLLKLNLEEEGDYEVEVVNVGGQVCDRARLFGPDVILLDFIMPGISGQAVADELAADPLTASIPIVFLTAVFSRDEAKLHGQGLHGHAVLSKPATVEEIMTALEKACADREDR